MTSFFMLEEGSGSVGRALDWRSNVNNRTLVNLYVDLLVFTRIAGTS